MVSGGAHEEGLPEMAEPHRFRTCCHRGVRFELGPSTAGLQMCRESDSRDWGQHVLSFPLCTAGVPGTSEGWDISQPAGISLHDLEQAWLLQTDELVVTAHPGADCWPGPGQRATASQAGVNFSWHTVASHGRKYRDRVIENTAFFVFLRSHISVW